MSLWSYLVWPFGFIMRFCYQLFNSYGVALFMYALITRAVLWPLTIKQHKNSLNMIRLKPYQDELMKKYGSNQQKYQQELMKLYQREGYSPMASCLPMLIQFPLIALIYTIVRRPLTYIAGWSLTEIWTKIQEIGIDNVAAGITTENFHRFELQLFSKLSELGQAPINTKFLGIIDLAKTPKDDLWSWLILIPILAGVTAFVYGWLSQKLSPMQQDAQTGSSMKVMLFVMPIISVWMSFEFTSALGVYWIASNLVGMLQLWLQNIIYNPKKVLAEVNAKMERERQILKEKKAAASAKKAAALAAAKGKKGKGKKPQPKPKAVDAEFTEVDEAPGVKDKDDKKEG